MTVLEQREIATTAIEFAYFAAKVKAYCKFAGKNLDALADRLGMSRSNLSHKLSGAYTLYVTEIKDIIKTLDEWETIAYQEEIKNLLQLAGLNQKTFEAESWYQQLEQKGTWD